MVTVETSELTDFLSARRASEALQDPAALREPRAVPASEDPRYEVPMVAQRQTQLCGCQMLTLVFVSTGLQRPARKQGE